jgi:hypothetical protein
MSGGERQDPVITTAGDQDSDTVVRELTQRWEQRVTGEISHDPSETAEVADLGTTYTQHNRPQPGGVVFANQGGAQNVYQAP